MSKNTKTVAAEKKATYKKEYGDKLKALLLPLDDYNSEYLEVLAIVPSRAIVSQVMKYLQSNPVKGQEILVKNCLLTSKEEVMNNDGLFFAAAGLISELMPIREGKFGKV